MADADLLQRLEAQFWTEDAAFYRSHLAEDCLMVFPGMGILNREQIIEGIAGGSRWEHVTIDDLQLAHPACDVAILAYRGTAEREGERYTALVSSLYARREGRWKLIFHQQSPE